MRKFKYGIIIFISLIFLIVNANIVLGTNFFDDEDENENSNSNSSLLSVEDDGDEEDDDDDNDIFLSDNTNTSTNTNKNSSVNNSSISQNRSVSNDNVLAKTGINDFGGATAVIVIICSISAVYSLKKISEYKNM